MPFGRKIEEEDSGLNLTSLVDILFILILFLVVTAHYSKVSALKVNLPKAKTAAAQEEKKMTTITLLNNGEIFLDDKRVEKENITSLLKKRKSEVEDLALVIRADRAARAGSLVLIMDKARDAGLSRISIEALLSK